MNWCRRRRAARTPLGRILIRDRADVHVIPVEKIDYVEVQDDYVAVKVGGRSLSEGTDAVRSRGACSTQIASCGSTAGICST